MDRRTNIKYHHFEQPAIEGGRLGPEGQVVVQIKAAGLSEPQA
jgi:hypothetical protein